MCFCIEVDLTTCFWPRRDQCFLKNMHFVHRPPSRPLGTTTNNAANNTNTTNTHDNNIDIPGGRLGVAWVGVGWSRSRWGSSEGGDDAVGNPHRAQNYKFELFVYSSLLVYFD